MGKTNTKPKAQPRTAGSLERVVKCVCCEKKGRHAIWLENKATKKRRAWCSEKCLLQTMALGLMDYVKRI